MAKLVVQTTDQASYCALKGGQRRSEGVGVGVRAQADKVALNCGQLLLFQEMARS